LGRGMSELAMTNETEDFTDELSDEALDRGAEESDICGRYYCHFCDTGCPR